MSLFDGRRLPAGILALDAERLRAGYYSDQYFNNCAAILSKLAEEGYGYAGRHPEVAEELTRGAEVGDLEVEMQFFNRRAPVTVAAGVDEALAILGAAAARPERLEVEAVDDGELLHPWEPALRVRGRYRDFAILETPCLGALTRGTRVATNVYETQVAARGKPLLFFPARFDLHTTQARDGYAYRLGVERYNLDHAGSARPLVSTHAQAAWWGGRGGGTVAHAYILAFLGDTAEAMLHFARLMPPEVPRVALVDTHNDCVRDSLRTARAMFERHRELLAEGDAEGAERYRLFAVRPDTAGEMRDVSVPPLGDPMLDCGVNPRLVWAMRSALDEEGERVAVPEDERELARAWFRGVKILVTGGFTAERIALFERLGVPIDMYGVGSALLRGPSTDFTADVVRVKLGGDWLDLAKAGRGRRDHPARRKVRLP
ncbi:MAG: nicotinate phosphoribosyltransferase [Armatimonadetes bacterium]|nr:nicotinate phosphoribosyltransferase [Armatimonadota bacterium]